MNTDMKKRVRVSFLATGVLFLLFGLLTAAVRTIDVQPIGPQQSRVGLATINRFMLNLLGHNLFWYEITDWLGAVAMLVAIGFAVLGLAQLIKRRSIKRVDAGILALGAFYVLVIAFYVFFEVCAVNYRPLIIHTSLEASYPSSHAMIVLCIMATAILEFHVLLKNGTVRKIADIVSISMIVVTFIGRLLSGVHWFTDMMGGLLLGAALVMLYYSATQYIHYRLRPVANEKKRRNTIDGNHPNQQCP